LKRHVSHKIFETDSINIISHLIRIVYLISEGEEQMKRKGIWKKILVRAITLTIVLMMNINMLVFSKENQQTVIVNNELENHLVIEFITPNYTIEQLETGEEIIQIDGFNLSGIPGQPLLPKKVYSVALPPTIDPASVSLEILDITIDDLPGSHNLKLATPDQSQCSKNFTDEYVDLQAAINISEESIRIHSLGQMRKWIFARLEFSPFRIDPESGELSVVEKISVSLHYDLRSSTMDAALMHDSVMDELAEEMFINFDSANNWYDDKQDYDKPNATYNYVIITTNAIESGSTKLSNFVAHKQLRGYQVLVITEDDYSSLTGQAPNETADKIRKWLQNNYILYGIEYVLLIGNPTPGGASSIAMPMKMCWPKYNVTNDRSPTDYYYADLSGDWDKNANQDYGEWTGDYSGVTGGVDFTPEVYVGRIPHYNSVDFTTLDNILQKIIDYENETNPMSWRQSTLLPMSFSEAGYDGAPLAEQMIDDFFNSKSYSDWTMYQQGNGACGADSIYASDEELRGGITVRDRWSANDYGVMVWWGHGSATSAMVGYTGCDDGTLMSSAYATSLDDDHPSHAFLISCQNGWAENSDNLGYALLKNGAISTVSASRNSYYNIDVGYGQFDGSTTNSGIAYEYTNRLVNFIQASGNALYNAKSSMTPESSTRLMNYYDFNLYGDPSTGITSTDTTKKVYLPSIIRESPGVSFTSDFNGSASGWTPESGAWVFYLDYAYEGSRTDIGWISIMHEGKYTNFDYSVSLWATGVDSSSNGLIFQGTPDPLDLDQDWNSGYKFLYTRNGNYSIWRFNNSFGAMDELLGWTYSPSLVTGSAWNTLRVVAYNNTFNFYINGNWVFAATDPTYTSGNVGIMKYTTDGINSKIWVDWASLSTLSSSSNNIPSNLLKPFSFENDTIVIGDMSGVILPEGELTNLESLTPPKP